VGNALAEVRDNRLYKAEHKTFEDYCREKWNLSKRHCDRLVASSAAAEAVRPIGPSSRAPIPVVESQARPLAKLPTAPLQRQAWTAAVETAKAEGSPAPKARHVEQAVKTEHPARREVATD
jgi:hypothetical protein